MSPANWLPKLAPEGASFPTLVAAVLWPPVQALHRAQHYEANLSMRRASIIRRNKQ